MAVRKDFLEFLPLYPDEDEATIRARWNGWLNEGLDPVEDVDLWTDTREGSIAYILTQPGVREAAREYDLMGTEVVAAAIPLWAWGSYLDDHGEVRNIFRLGATPAGVDLLFTGTVGTPIPSGTRVSAPPVSPDDEPPSFETTEPAEIQPGGTVTVPARSVETGANQNLASNALTILEIPTPGVTGVNNPVAATGGTDPETDESFAGRVLDQFQDYGSANEQTYTNWARDFEGVGGAAIIAEAFGPGTVLVVVYTAEGGPVSQATVDGLQDFLDPARAQTTLRVAADLPDPAIEVVSTSGFRTAAVGNPMWIRVGDQLVQHTGQDADSFTGASGGVGPFPVGTRVSQSGRGGGQAPIGHHVLVRTASVMNVDVVATIEMEPGYSLDDAMKERITEAIREYVESVPPGSEIVRNQVLKQILSVPEVHDCSLPTLNGGGNITVPSSPAQVPHLDDVTLTAGSV